MQCHEYLVILQNVDLLLELCNTLLIFAFYCWEVVCSLFILCYQTLLNLVLQYQSLCCARTYLTHLGRYCIAKVASMQLCKATLLFIFLGTKAEA